MLRKNLAIAWRPTSTSARVTVAFVDTDVGLRLLKARSLSVQLTKCYVWKCRKPSCMNHESNKETLRVVHNALDPQVLLRSHKQVSLSRLR
eukprot:6482143-Amphidinium_carterae.4